MALKAARAPSEYDPDAELSRDNRRGCTPLLDVLDVLADVLAREVAHDQSAPSPITLERLGPAVSLLGEVLLTTPLVGLGSQSEGRPNVVLFSPSIHPPRFGRNGEGREWS